MERARIHPERRARLLVLGPTGAGKTSLVRGAAHAIGTGDHEATRLRVRHEPTAGLVGPPNAEPIDAMLADWREQVREDGRVASTEALSDIWLRVGLDDGAASGQGGMVWDVLLTDVSGGKTVPDDARFVADLVSRMGEAEFERLRRHLVFANGVALVLPVHHSSYVAVLVDLLSTILDLREPVSAGGRPLRCACCLSMVDRWFEDEPVLAAMRPARPDDRRTHYAWMQDRRWVAGRIATQLRRDGLGELRNTLRRAEREAALRFFPLSSFGFAPGTGQANHRRRDDGTGTYLTTPRSEDPEGYDERHVFGADMSSTRSILWRPFGTVEPLLHLALGEAVGPLGYAWGEVFPDD
ncbi:MAG: hypothetical protein ACFBWO_17240 [Paracoccaceae bacterium]